MIRIIVFLIASTLLCSCATLFNRDYVAISFTAETPVELIHENTAYPIDTVHPFIMNVKRDKKNVPIVIKKDSVSRESSIPWKYHNALYTEIILLPYFIIDFGLGLHNKRIYTYRDSYLIDRRLNLRKPPIFKYKEGDLYLTLSLPLVNMFNVVPKDESRYIKTLIGGFGAGIDYYYKYNRFFNFSLNNSLGIELKNGSSADNETEYIDNVSTYLSATHNHRWKHISVGYGLTFNYNEWRKLKDLYDINDDYIGNYGKLRTNTGIGILLNTHFYFNDNSYIGISYRPSLISFGKAKVFDYEHLISFSFGFKIRLTKRK